MPSLEEQVATLTAERDEARARVALAETCICEPSLKQGGDPCFVGFKALLDRTVASESARDAALAAVARLRTALFMIANTSTENSFGDTKDYPGGYYKDIARAALAPKGAPDV